MQLAVAEIVPAADKFREQMLRPCHASLIGGDRRSSSGSLATFTANRRALVVRQPIWSPSGATQRYVRNRGEKRKSAAYT
jgi:hypothetical protein